MRKYINKMVECFCRFVQEMIHLFLCVIVWLPNKSLDINKFLHDVAIQPESFTTHMYKLRGINFFTYYGIIQLIHDILLLISMYVRYKPMSMYFDCSKRRLRTASFGFRLPEIRIISVS